LNRKNTKDAKNIALLFVSFVFFAARLFIFFSDRAKNRDAEVAFFFGDFFKEPNLQDVACLRLA